VAGIAMWFWKRWGIYLYVVAGVATALLFLMRTASMWMFFGAFLPMIIVGYILQPRLKYFK
jgi:Na+-translocating ferredoxin:NAD+ oxidoreductase RnfE subunit